MEGEQRLTGDDAVARLRVHLHPGHRLDVVLLAGAAGAEPPGRDPDGERVHPADVAVALLTGMDTPLGLTAGNALEVRESVEVLAGGGPADVVELTVELAREMLAAAGRPDADPAPALQDGRAMDVWRRMIVAQGGDPDAPLPVAEHQHTVAAQGDGYVSRMDAFAVGVAAWRLGAGRARKEDPVQAAAGIELHAIRGDSVRAGEPLLTLHTDTPERFARATEALAGAIDIGSDEPETSDVVYERIAP